MARSDDYEGTPRPDVYLALLILTTFAMVVAIVIMWIENSMLKS
jgi:hypothetical protein